MLKDSEKNDALENREHFITQQFFFFKKRHIYYKVAINDILYAQSDDNYVQVQVRNAETFTLRITLKNLEELLPSEAFLRTHRRFIVAVEHIEAINFQDSTLLIDGMELPVSQTKRQELEAHIQKLG